MEGPGRVAEPAPVVVVAGFWRRLAAAAVDAAVVLPLTWVLGVVIGGVLGIHLPAARFRGPDYWLDLALEAQPAFLGAVGLLVGLSALYLYLFQATLGHTLGMRLLKLQVIDLYGDQPGPARSAIRTAGYFVCGLTLSLGFVWIAFDREKRGLHDWLAGTYVIRARAA